MYDEDMINEQNRENYLYPQWEREQKNKILAMHDTKKKQTAWQRLFPRTESSDDWMLNANVF